MSSLNKWMLACIASVLPALVLFGPSAWAQNSAQATAAAQKHLADKARFQPADGAWATALASCKRAAGSNFIKQQKCVFDHCNGHWGVGDCPQGTDVEPFALPSAKELPARKPAAPGAWAAQLANCKNAAGLNPVAREQCVWKHCPGHWGQGECPAGRDNPLLKPKT